MLNAAVSLEMLSQGKQHRLNRASQTLGGVL